MDLTTLLESGEITKVFKYTRNGTLVEVSPEADCTIDGTDELDQLRKVSGALYFYGQALGEIETALSKKKSTIKQKSGACYQKNHIELTNNKVRVTDKMLEHLVNTDPEIIQLKNEMAELEGAKVKLDTIITALKLKDGDLNELSRRKSQELRGINKLT